MKPLALAIMKPLAIVMGFLFSLVGAACVMLVTVAGISSGMWGLGHTAPVLLIGIPALTLGIVRLLFGLKRSPAPFTEC